ncbi:hypothetical protein [Nonlabens antarcticus]|uniref:hypothetical protein n=1 Tax=Nonlabens antarcticus TaxID=392714 RepID=UPI001891B673|nr:hypothetical protein [Nonlabens antarcticus]
MKELHDLLETLISTLQGTWSSIAFLKIKNELHRGFTINHPAVFIPWNITENELALLFSGKKLQHISEGYYTLPCEPLKGLDCTVGFHFNLQLNGILNELEFFRVEPEG